MAAFFDIELHDQPALAVLRDRSATGGPSITNAAEDVVVAVALLVPDLHRRRVIYQDSDGVWDELVIDSAGRFVDFRLIRARTLQGAIDDIRQGRV